MSDRVFGAIALALCAGMAAMAWQLDPPISYEPIGPSAYPLLLAALMATLSLGFVLRPGPEPHWPRGTHRLHVLAMVAVLFGYAVLFQPLGFVAATLLVTVGLGRLFGGDWKRCAIGGALLSIGLYVLFDKLLDVVLPVGDLWTTVGLA